MTERERFLLTLLYLMQEEIKCLRSVLSEWNHDTSSYVQSTQADILKNARETLEHKL